MGRDLNIRIGMNGGEICNAYIQRVDEEGPEVWALYITTLADAVIWSGLLTNPTPEGVYTNNGTGADDTLPATLTVVLVAGTATASDYFTCQS